MHTFQTKPRPKQELNEQANSKPVEEHEEIKCGHCGHIREADTHVPEWQCPCCSSAYRKVDPAYKREQSQTVRQDSLEREASATQKRLRSETITGLLSGLSIIGTAIGSAGATCGRVASSPAGIAFGLLIVAGSIGYFLLKSGAT